MTRLVDGVLPRMSLQWIELKEDRHGAPAPLRHGLCLWRSLDADYLVRRRSFSSDRSDGHLTCRRSALSTLICNQFHDQPGMDPVRRALRMSCFIMSCRGCGYSAWCAQLTTWNMDGGARVAHRLILQRQRSPGAESENGNARRSSTG